MLDQETRELLTEVKSTLAETNKVRAAVQQLEEQMKGVPSTIENKLAAMRRMVFDDRGNYRGVAFGCEEEARGFGLFVLAKTAGDQRALGALKAEFKDVFQRAFGDAADALLLVCRRIEFGWQFPLQFGDRPNNPATTRFSSRTESVRI